MTGIRSCVGATVAFASVAARALTIPVRENAGSVPYANVVELPAFSRQAGLFGLSLSVCLRFPNGT